jgi:hypothetical protein
LNFETARLIPATDGIAASDALPGWSAFLGTNQQSSIQYNINPAAFNPRIALIGSNVDVIGGNFCVYLGNGTISQTGVIPSGTESLLFDAISYPGSPSPPVSLGGVNLSSTLISIATNAYGHGYGNFAVDISGFAGQVETLNFSGYAYLDSIQFSPEAIPEPSAASLICLGGALLFYLRRKYLR